MTGKWVEHFYVRPAASDGGSRRDIRNVRTSEKPKLRNSAPALRTRRSLTLAADGRRFPTRQSEMAKRPITHCEKAKVDSWTFQAFGKLRYIGQFKLRHSKLRSATIAETKAE
ncbi:hypothetical protein C8J57DRAFT_1232402 [Mycena rebaudengoi]|nr:hypothetical protein C8J57DRAFT_1232402 [Mycena rebaudengoi]